MVPLELEEWLGTIRLPLERIKQKAEHAIRALCEDYGYAYAGRLKEDQSLAEKLETGRVRRLDDLEDLFGCAIIIPNLAHEAAVLDRLGKMFSTMYVKSRGKTHKNPDIFRFEATRFIGRLRIADPEDGRLGSVSFEVQVRTAFEHAWSVATHSPAYKPDRPDWKLERLAAQMKALVEQLDSLALAYGQSADVLIQHPCVRTECEARVFDQYRALTVDGLIPGEIQPAKWGLFSRNIVALADAADWGGRMYLEDKIERLLAAVSDELRRIGKSGYPLSLSLYQFTLGLLVQSKTIRPQFRDDMYFPPVSAALEAMYPMTRDVRPRCQMTAGS